MEKNIDKQLLHLGTTAADNFNVKRFESNNH